MNFLFIGYGSIAKKHINLLRDKLKKVSIYVLKHRYNQVVSDKVNLITSNDLNNYDFDSIFICSPSKFHYEHLIEFSKLNVPIFIEKPICINKLELIKLNALSPKIESLVFVGFNLRFHPITIFFKNYIETNSLSIFEVISYCGSYLPNWRSNRSYVDSYSSNKEQGGGVHLDLIHDVDLIFYFFGEPLNFSSEKATLSNLKITSFDWARIQLNFEKFKANIFLNYFRLEPKRDIEIVTSIGSYKLDYINNTIHLGDKIIFSDANSMKKSYSNQIDYFLNETKKPAKNISLNESLKVIEYVL